MWHRLNTVVLARCFSNYNTVITLAVPSLPEPSAANWLTGGSFSSSIVFDTSHTQGTSNFEPLATRSLCTVPALPMPLLSLCRAIPIDLPPPAVREIVSDVSRSRSRKPCTHHPIYSALTLQISVLGATVSQRKSSCEAATERNVWSGMDQKHRRVNSSPSEETGATWRPSS